MLLSKLLSRLLPKLPPKINYPPLNKPAILIFSWFSIFLPIYAFYRFYIYELESFSCGGGIYICDDVFLNINAIIIFIITVILTPKMFRYFWYKGLIVLGFVVYYVDTCFKIAWGGRILFGNTWQKTEVLRGFLLYEWSFYLLGLVGLLFYYYCQSLYYRNSRKYDVSE